MSRIRAFLRHRFGWPDYVKPFVEKPLPENLHWTVTLGSVLVLLFIIQGVTGMFLALYYNPSPDHAYQAVNYIMGEVFLGRLLRGIHHWGASAMVIIVVAHMMVSFFTGAFKPPREMTWMIGVCLLLLTLGFGFTGYLLPWDQKAYWATVVGTNIPRDIPLLGKFIARMLLAGDAVSGLTLTRFYAIHTLTFPVLAAACIGLHLYLVRIHDISEPVARSDMPCEPVQETYYHFFPEHVARASVAFAVVFSVILLLAVFADIPREEVAGTLDPDYLPRPEWYYMWLFQLLTLFPGRTEMIGSLVIPMGGVILLFCLPFLSHSPYRSAAQRPLATAIGVACLVGIVYLSVMGIANSRPYGEIIRIPERKLTASEMSGLKIFVARDCAYCHQIMGGGGRRQGPDLSNVVARDRTKKWLVRFIKNPQSVNSWSTMPKYDLTQEELHALANFILSLDFTRYAVRTVSRQAVVDGKIE